MLTWAIVWLGSKDKFVNGGGFLVFAMILDTVILCTFATILG